MLPARSARAAVSHCRHVKQTQSGIPTASCSYTTTATATASQASTAASADNEDGTGYRSQLLAAALPLIPEHGFSLKAIQEAARSIPLSSPSTSSSLSNTTPLFLEQLFPSLPNRLNRSTTHKTSSRLSRLLSQKPSERIFGRDIFKSAATPLPLDDVLAYAQTDAEAIGPRRALFEAWAEEGLRSLKSEEAQQGKDGTPQAPMGQKKLEELLERRLAYNEPVLQHLMSVLATLAKTNPAQSSLPSFKPYLTHVGSIASALQASSKMNISTTRLATVYSLAEFYQLSSSRPSLAATLDYARDMLESTRKYDVLIRDGIGFVEYAAKSWKNIIAARGM